MCISLRSVTGRMLFNEVNICHQCRARIAALQQVVTQNEIVRKAPINGLAKRIHIIDTFANKRPLSEVILIDIRYFTGVGIDARFAREQFRES